jgi:hypothetical protein
MNYDTRSEELFAAVCDRFRYSVKLLMMHADSRRQSADFEITAPGSRFVAGIEELNKIDFSPRHSPTPHVEWTVGARARKALRAVSVQLRPYKERSWPLLVVLYDNVTGAAMRAQSNLEAPQIDAAMYGDDPEIRHTTAGSAAPDWIGEDRTLTATDRTYISAVAVISAWDQRSVFFFHNTFAKVPFPSRLFNDSYCHHFEKRGKPYSENWKWHKLVYLAD